MVNAYNRYFAFWDREARNKGLKLILGGPAEAGNAALLNKLPYRRLAGSRYGNLHYWAHNDFNENPLLARAYERVQSVDAALATLPRAYKLVGTVDKSYREDNNFVGMLWWVGYRFLQRGYWRLRCFEKANGYFMRDELFMLARRWWHGRRMTGKDKKKLAEIKGAPFVFFPLATEPEASLQQFSPEFFFQHAAIVALSRDLPAGVKLVVKETVMGVGRRPDNFYKQIGELKNVVWMNMLEPGLEVARHAVAVAVITGTSGFEAAVMGTPVISFGLHNGYNMLPHVFHVTDLAKLRDAIRAIFDNGINEVAARREGARYLQAVIDSSFDLGDYDYVDLRKYDQSVVCSACDALENSLEFAASKAGRITIAG